MDLIYDDLVKAIEGREVVSLIHKGMKRIVEPYLIYETKAGKTLLHGWQTGGEWDKTPPPDWCNLHLDDISEVELLAKHYSAPHEGYNPEGPKFYRVLVATPAS